MEDAVCYLIGGAPRTGKTTFANKIAKENGTKVLSTDSLMVMMRKIVRREDYPELFFIDGHTVESFYQMYNTAQKVLDAEVKAGLCAEKGIIAILEHTLPAWRVVVLEGDVITPGIADRLKKKYPKTTFHTTFFYDDNEARVHDRIYSKRLWSRDEPYTDDVKPQEVAFVKAYNKWYLTEAKRYNVAVTHVDEY